MFDGASAAAAVHRDDHARRRSGTWRPVLLGARAPVAAQLHVQVQGDGRRGPATPVVARVPQRVASRRSPATVSRSACSLHTLASTPPGMSGTYPPPNILVGGTSTGISPQYHYVLSDIADQYWLPSVRSASSRFHSAIRRHQLASVRQADSRLTRLVPPTTLNSR